MAADSTIHASAVLAGPKAILIRGPSGSGKSLLAWNLINAASRGLLKSFGSCSFREPIDDLAALGLL